MSIDVLNEALNEGFEAIAAVVLREGRWQIVIVGELDDAEAMLGNLRMAQRYIEDYVLQRNSVEEAQKGD
jgi:hypothetical protein